MNGVRGFTLVELMMATALVATLLAVGLPPLGDALRRQRVTASMQMLMADMAMARNTAVMRGQQVVLCPSAGGTECAGGLDWSRGWLVYVDADGNRRPDAPADLLRATAAPGGADGLKLTSSRPYLRYQADGRSAHSNLTLSVCAGTSLEGRLVVSNLGRVRSERPIDPAGCPVSTGSP